MVSHSGVDGDWIGFSIFFSLKKLGISQLCLTDKHDFLLSNAKNTNWKRIIKISGLSFKEFLVLVP